MGYFNSNQSRYPKRPTYLWKVRKLRKKQFPPNMYLRINEILQIWKHKLMGYTCNLPESLPPLNPNWHPHKISPKIISGKETEQWLDLDFDVTGDLEFLLSLAFVTNGSSCENRTHIYGNRLSSISLEWVNFLFFLFIMRRARVAPDFPTAFLTLLWGHEATYFLLLKGA